MLGPPRPIAGNKGTQIAVENLFYNVPARLRALSGKSEEFTKIVDVIGRYAIHCSGIAFSCKKSGETHPSFTVQRDASTLERIRALFGSAVANAVIVLDIPPDTSLGLTKVTGYVTNASYASKKAIQPIFFINGRLVSNEPLKRSISAVYSAYLPKGGKSFVYLALEIEPANLDVNVHPTKREVRFLFEDEIVETVANGIEKTLEKVDSGRTFQTQMILPGVFQVNATKSGGSIDKRPYEHQLVRTDAKQARLDSFVPAKHAAVEPVSDEKVFRPVHLDSIKALRRAVEESAHRGLTHMFASHTFVGVADYSRRLVALQHDVNLYLVNYAAVLKELFYQIGLSEFNNYGSILLGDNGVSVRWLLETALEDMEPNERKAVISHGIAQLHNMSEMLADHFQLKFEIIGDRDGEPEDLSLDELPLLLVGYVPSLNKLPTFIHHLISRVNWSHERECFEGILNALALFQLPDPVDSTSSDPADEEHRRTIASDLETLLFPAVKSRLIAPRSLVDSVVQIADLPSLYRVFERC
jgi:DNA mismatch repair protein MLH1